MSATGHTTNLETQVIKYCKQRGILIKDGRIPQEYKAEINDFVKMQSNKMKVRKTEDSRKISEILKTILPQHKITKR